MSTIIYPAPIFGPVHSRRLGVSLGINLLPGDGKFCTFDCIYCECGYNKDFRPKQKVQTREAVREALEKRLAEMKENGPFPDVLTFAGNGEPTANPYFPEIIEDTLALRDKYFPNAKVSVLSNATLIHNPKVFAALNDTATTEIYTLSLHDALPIYPYPQPESVCRTQQSGQQYSETGYRGHGLHPDSGLPYRTL